MSSDHASSRIGLPDLSAGEDGIVNLSAAENPSWHQGKAAFEHKAGLESRHQLLKETVAADVMRLTKFSLLATVSLLGILVIVDSGFLYLKVIAPADRLVSEKVLITMIGATIVQVGGAMAAIVYSFFKTSDSKEPILSQE